MNLSCLSKYPFNKTACDFHLMIRIYQLFKKDGRLSFTCQTYEGSSSFRVEFDSENPS